jgi:hypothetical protein
MVALEDCLPLISFFDSDIVIAPADIQFGEILGLLEFVN